MRIRFAVAVLLLATVEHGSLAIAQGPGTFTQTGNMTTPRLGHTATLLPDGKVLIAGGCQNRLRAASASAELYDPSTCRSVPDAPLSVHFVSHDLADRFLRLRRIVSQNLTPFTSS